MIESNLDYNQLIAIASAFAVIVGIIIVVAIREKYDERKNKSNGSNTL